MNKKSQIKMIRDWREKFKKNPLLKSLSILNVLTEKDARGDSITKVFVYCRECSHSDWRLAKAVLVGKGCIPCAQRKGLITKNTEAGHINRLIENTYIKREEISEVYRGKNRVLRFKGICSVCDYDWDNTYEKIQKSNGCKQCNKERKRKALIETKVKEALKVNKLIENVGISGYYINKHSQIMLNCFCKDCGNLWNTRIDDMIIGCGCPDCACMSGPEERLKLYLQENNIEFDTQKRFEDCKYKNTLPFDFYIPQYNLLCEVQGGQHTRPIKYWGGEEGFKHRVMIDKIKKDYAETNNYNYLAIYEEEVADIGLFLKEALQQLKPINSSTL